MDSYWSLAELDEASLSEAQASYHRANAASKSEDREPAGPALAMQTRSRAASPIPPKVEQPLLPQAEPAGPGSWLPEPEMASWMVGCLGRSGYEVELVEDEFGSGFDMDLENQSVDEFREALGMCEDDAVAEGLARPPGYVKSDAEWEVEYEGRLEVKTCLEDAGYEIGPAPMLSGYVDGNGLWSPHQVVIEALGPRLAAASFKECQQ